MLNAKAKAKAKAIYLLLNENTLKGVICMEDFAMNKGELCSAPRESAKDIMQCRNSVIVIVIKMIADKTFSYCKAENKKEVSYK